MTGLTVAFPAVISEVLLS